MENRGYIISGIGHVCLILWVLFGGWFWQSHSNPAVTVANVSLISPQQFQSLTAASSAPPKTPQTEVKPPKSTMAPATSPAPQSAPKPEAAPKPQIAPKPERKPEAQDVRPEPDVAPAPPPPPPAPKISEKPKTRKIDRVAPTPAPKSEAKAAPKTQEATKPEQETKAPTPEKPKEATAPKEAASLIATEDNTAKENAAPISLAPAASPRPMQRPNRVAETTPTPAPKPETPKPEKPKPEKPKPQKTPAKSQDNAVNDAVAAALASAVSDSQGKTKGKIGNGTASEGPPLTSAEKEGLTLAVQKCWYVDVGSAAANITVTLGFSLNPNGTVVSGSVHQISVSNGSPDAQRAAYDAARRAVLVCGADGYQLPVAQYDQWKSVEVTFNPAEMRSR